MAARPLFWLALAWAVLGFGGLAGRAHADIQEPLEAHTSGERMQRRGQENRRQPANGSPLAVEIHQGETIEIVLHAHGQSGKTIDFTISSPPAHGTLAGPPRPLTRNTASVTYIHRAEDGPGDDTFSFSVQAAGSAKSAGVPVSIKVHDLPPIVAATPAELDFGAVKAGESTRATLTLENRGGGMATGRVEPPAPWIVDGAADYHLAHGETQSFQIVFQPSYGRSYAENEHFHLEEGGGVRLIGTGIGPRDPSEDLAHPAAVAAVSTPASPIAAAIARNNALAIAAENAAVAAAAGSAPANPTPASATPDRALVPGSPVMPTPAPALAAAAPDIGPTGNGLITLGTGGADSVMLNAATVKTAELRGAGTSTLDLAWKPPRPTPRSYRIELRYLTLDTEDKLRVDWRPYARVEIRPTQDLVTARVSGLPAGTRQTLRIVAVDDEGRLAAPSATLTVQTRVASTWWHVTPLKVLVLLLVVCLGLLVYRKWEERQILQGLDERREAREAELLHHRH